MPDIDPATIVSDLGFSSNFGSGTPRIEPELLVVNRTVAVSIDDSSGRFTSMLSRNALPDMEEMRVPDGIRLPVTVIPGANPAVLVTIRVKPSADRVPFLPVTEDDAVAFWLIVTLLPFRLLTVVPDGTPNPEIGSPGLTPAPLERIS